MYVIHTKHNTTYYQLALLFVVAILLPLHTAGAQHTDEQAPTPIPTPPRRVLHPAPEYVTRYFGLTPPPPQYVTYVFTTWPNDHPYAPFNYADTICPHTTIGPWDTMEIPALPGDTVCATDGGQVTCMRVNLLPQAAPYNTPSITTYTPLPPALPVIVTGQTTCVVIFSTVPAMRYSFIQTTTTRAFLLVPHAYPCDWHKR